MVGRVVSPRSKKSEKCATWGLIRQGQWAQANSHFEMTTILSKISQTMNLGLCHQVSLPLQRHASLTYMRVTL